ncbi:hypothetical protein RZS08_11520, partial [Arthrospira platensis SPKY1]|nr:hypothetical protein [Arthrospira platensis SPKY1]
FRVFAVAYPGGGQLPRAAANGDGVSEFAQRGAEPVTLLPTPRATRGGSATETIALLPTPAVNDMGAGKTVEQWDEWTAKMKAAHGNGNGNGHGASLAIEALRAPDFGPYAAAVARWETVLGRPAPDPTEPGTNGQPRLSPAFVQWMMGLPEGWVSDTGIPPNAQLKALGNGVVPQQAALALRLLGAKGENQ